MAKVYVSETGADVVIASNDHCPPHVHVLHRGEGWLVRLWFSYVSEAVGVRDIAPTERAVRRPQLKRLLNELQDNLAACRKLWWETRATTCLENKWVVRLASGCLEVLEARRRSARQVRSATYDASTQMMSVEFRDGAEEQVRCRGGTRGEGT